MLTASLNHQKVIRKLRNVGILFNNVDVLQFTDHVNSDSKSVPTSIDTTKLLTEGQLPPQVILSLIKLYLTTAKPNCHVT